VIRGKYWKERMISCMIMSEPASFGNSLDTFSLFTVVLVTMRLFTNGKLRKEIKQEIGKLDLVIKNMR